MPRKANKRKAIQAAKIKRGEPRKRHKITVHPVVGVSVISATITRAIIESGILDYQEDPENETQTPATNGPRNFPHRQRTRKRRRAGAGYSAIRLRQWQHNATGYIGSV